MRFQKELFLKNGRKNKMTKYEAKFIMPIDNPYNNQVGGDHYQKYEIQPSEFINKNKLLFAEGSAIKYIVRHQDKGGKESLEKAKHFIDMIIERDYS